MDIKKIHIKRLIRTGCVGLFLSICTVFAVNGRIERDIEIDYENSSYTAGAVKALSYMTATENARIKAEYILNSYAIKQASTIEVAAPAPETEVHEVQNVAQPEPIVEDTVQPVQEVQEILVEETKPHYSTTNTDYLNEDELMCLAKCVFAEDGSEPIESQEYIVDAILNMVDDPRYPDSIQGVVFNPGSFEVISLGMYDTAVPNERTWQAIYNELPQFGGERNSFDVEYFRTSHYHTFGTPMFNINNVYFSKK